MPNGYHSPEPLELQIRRANGQANGGAPDMEAYPAEVLDIFIVPARQLPTVEPETGPIEPPTGPAVAEPLLAEANNSPTETGDPVEPPSSRRRTEEPPQQHPQCTDYDVPAEPDVPTDQDVPVPESP